MGNFNKTRFSYTHAVANHNELSRAVLIVDVWHPQLPEAERQALAEMHMFIPQRKTVALNQSVHAQVMFS